MGEQGNDHVDAADDSAVAERPSPNGDAALGSTVRVGDRSARPRGPGGVRRAVQRVLNGLAAAVRLVASLFAVVLIVRIGFAFITVNPQNVIVAWIVARADVLVWGFRDLFVPADPRIGLLANYGLAAVFWVVAGVLVGWLLSSLGQLVGGRS